MNDAHLPETPTHLDDLQQVVNLVKTHGQSVAVAAAVVVILVAAWNAYRAHQRTTLRRAETQLAEAASVEDLTAIADRYKATPSAPIALLRLAKEQFNAGRYTEAMDAYETFLQRYPNHDLAGAAKVGLLHGMEAMGRLEEALDGFKRFVADNPDHFLMPQALLGQARCLELLGRPDEARVLHEDFLTAHPDHPWRDRVEESLKALERHVARGGLAVPAAVAEPAPTPAEAAVPAPAKEPAGAGN